MKKEKVPVMLRLEPSIVMIMDACIEALKKGGVTTSRNSLIGEILESVSYSKDIKVIEYGGDMCSLLEIEGSSLEIEKQLCKDRYRLQKYFERANNISSDGKLNVSSFLSLTGMLEASKCGESTEYYVAKDKLLVALDIEARVIGINDKVKEFAVNRLTLDMCTYVKESNKFIKTNKINSNDDFDTYYKINEYRLNKNDLSDAKTITITKYLENVTGKPTIRDLGFQVESVDGEIIEDEIITGVNFDTEDEALDYLASCVEMDLRKLGDKLIIKEA